MAISDLNGDHINQLIDMIPVVYEGTENTIVPVLEKIRDRIPIDAEEKKLIETWSVVPAKGKGGGYKAAMCLTYILIQRFKENNLI